MMKSRREKYSKWKKINNFIVEVLHLECLKHHWLLSRLFISLIENCAVFFEDLANIVNGKYFMFAKQFKLLIHWAYEHDNSLESVLNEIFCMNNKHKYMVMVTHVAEYSAIFSVYIIICMRKYFILDWRRKSCYVLLHNRNLHSLSLLTKWDCRSIWRETHEI